MIRYAATIFLSAFLLFQIQPLSGKYILPWFGGTPAVWTTCMLFFQMLLLGGYAYAHWSISRLSPRRQGTVHLGLLLITLGFLPIIPDAQWQPTGTESPTWRILLILGWTVGLPYLALSSTAPLIQAWFSRDYSDRSPYRLYALSNFGSLLGLLSYPFAVEPNLALHTQGHLWSGLFVGFVLLCGYCAWRVRGHAAAFTAASKVLTAGAREDKPMVFDRLLWLALPACGSVMLLATTNQLSQDVAAVPFLWVVPLALYLTSFIITFDSPRGYWRPLWAMLLPVAIGGAYMAMAIGPTLNLITQIVLYNFALLACTMVLHGELARIKPNPHYLTGFYLSISAGGALGGVLVSIVAPHVLDMYLEFPVALLGSMALFALVLYRQGWGRLHSGRWAVHGVIFTLLFLIGLLLVWRFGQVLGDFNQTVREGVTALVQNRNWPYVVKQRLYDVADESWQMAMLLVCALLLGVLVIVTRWSRESSVVSVVLPSIIILIAGGLTLALIKGTLTEKTIARHRNFYGVLRVEEDRSDHFHNRALLHGRITHGIQDLLNQGRRKPTTYYAPDSGIGVAIRTLRQLRGENDGLRIGVVGLGTGTIAAYGQHHDLIRFYEINPLVLDISNHYFFYRKDTQATLDITLGDARITMEQERRQDKPAQFDVLAVDAFSGDAVPLHLLTREAFANYFYHLKPDGILAIHISNLYLDLGPLVHDLAEEAGYQAMRIENDNDQDNYIYFSIWALVTKSGAVLQHELIKAYTKPWPEREDNRKVVFTDDYSNLLSILNK